MTPPKTRSQRETVTEEKDVKQPEESRSVKIKSKASDKSALQKTFQENIILKKELENLKVKYSEKKQINRELRKTIAEQDQKIGIQDNYILKLKKERKKAEQINKNNVANIMTTSAQNQALMAVLSQQQSVQTILPGPLLSNNVAMQQSFINSMPYAPLYPSTATQPTLQPHLFYLDSNFRNNY